MRNYFMHENKRRNKFVIEYPKLFATDRHCSRARGKIAPCYFAIWRQSSPKRYGISDFAVSAKIALTLILTLIPTLTQHIEKTLPVFCL